MNKVTTIHLNGNAFQLEESAYEALRNYLDNAARQLEGNPDRQEILADIERAIADKCRAVLGPHKTVVVSGEVETILAEVGPVQDPTEGPNETAGAGATSPGGQGGASSQSQGTGSPARRLYKIKEGAKIGGVCNGLAAYLNIDVSILRVFFAFLVFCWGFGLLLYILMLILIPVAVTPAEKAAAFGGGSPSTAGEFVRRAKQGYYEGMKTFKDKQAHREWKRRFRSEMRGWKSNFHREMRATTAEWSNCRTGAEPPPSGVGFGLTLTFLEVLGVAATLLCVYAVWSLFVHGSVFGVQLPAGVPTWMWIIILIFVCKMVTTPAKVMRWTARHGGSACGVTGGLCIALANTCIGVALMILFLWVLAHHGPEVHRVLHEAATSAHQAIDSIRDGWNKK